MQAYGAGFARVYNLRWGSFAQQLAPRLHAFYQSTPVGQVNRKVLDLCCGTGQLAVHFLDHDYQVTGLDLSEPMLEYARANAAPYLLAGQARFVRGDAADFQLDETFGLVVSTFDALNHLPDMASLTGCFGCVFSHLAGGGTFVFDLNTRLGLKRWNSISVEDTDEMTLINRAVYDEEAGKAYTRISGFYPAGDGLYRRFEETAYNTVFDLEAVRRALLDEGFARVHFARSQDLTLPVGEPENESRIFVVASKGES